MAGIGFALRRAYDRGGAFAPLIALGHATVLASGPWIFAIASMALITAVTEPIVGLERLADFRVAVIYAFALSLLLSSPVCVVASRLVSDALHAREDATLEPVLVGALVLVLVLTLPVAAAVFLVGFGLLNSYGAAILMCTATASLVWVTVAFCGVIKDFWSITAAFFVGLALGAVLCIGLSLFDLGADAMVCGLTAGLAVTFLYLTLTLLRALPASRPLSGVLTVVCAGRVHWLLSGGAFCAAAAIWADKVVVWVMRGEAAPGGLRHAPLYDSAMFLGCLIVLPALGKFVTEIDTTIFERTRDYLWAVLKHRTLASIEMKRVELERATTSGLNRVILGQIGLCAIFVILAPLLVGLVNLRYSQISMVRLAALGSTFQLVFLISSTVIVWFNRQRLFCVLQLCALLLNAGLTAAFIVAGERFAGMGFVTAFVLCGTVSYLYALKTLADLTYIVFVANRSD